MKPSESNFKAEITESTQLYHEIVACVVRFEPSTVLEIGSADGRGSTTAFINAVEEPSKEIKVPSMVCLEAVPERFGELRSYVLLKPWITPILASSVETMEYMSELEIGAFFEMPETKEFPVQRFGAGTVASWRQGELVNIINNNIPQDGIRQAKHIFGGMPDMVLIDGSCFTANAELAEVFGSDVIILDDVRGIKNWKNYKLLKDHDDYVTVNENMDERNGYAVFKRKKDAKTADKA